MVTADVFKANRAINSIIRREVRKLSKMFFVMSPAKCLNFSFIVDRDSMNHAEPATKAIGVRNKATFEVFKLTTAGKVRAAQNNALSITGAKTSAIPLVAISSSTDVISDW